MNPLFSVQPSQTQKVQLHWLARIFNFWKKHIRVNKAYICYPVAESTFKVFFLRVLFGNHFLLRRQTNPTRLGPRTIANFVYFTRCLGKPEYWWYVLSLSTFRAQKVITLLPCIVPPCERELIKVQKYSAMVCASKKRTSEMEMIRRFPMISPITVGWCWFNPLSSFIRNYQVSPSNNTKLSHDFPMKSHGCVWKWLVPLFTQWFCWSLSRF